jgi:hypothetical protein
MIVASVSSIAYCVAVELGCFYFQLSKPTTVTHHYGIDGIQLSQSPYQLLLSQCLSKIYHRTITPFSYEYFSTFTSFSCLKSIITFLYLLSILNSITIIFY